MSRLYDRVMANGCESLTATHVMRVAAETTPDFPEDAGAAESFEEKFGRRPDEAEMRVLLAAQREAWREHVSSDVFDAAEFRDAVVVAAEEVGQFWATLPLGTNTLDIVDRLVGPFERVFIEFQNVPNIVGLRSWGVLIESTRYEREPQEDFEAQGWELTGLLVGEWEKGEPVGPIVRWVIPLDADGRAYPGDGQGEGSFFAHPLTVGTMPEEDLHKIVDEMTHLLGPALFAISLMHCKNVDVHPVDPPERLSKKHQRRHGRPLSRYYVLNIEPISRVLISDGEAQSKGLRHAMHICRGHFKTYTEDAPLFGKHLGTYWWESQARGKAEHGVVEKDYRVRLDQGLGQGFRGANEYPEMSRTAPEHTGTDPDLGGRGLKAHNVTQNLLAAAVRDAGYEPTDWPKPSEPQYDLAWEAGDVTWVAEVKSLTSKNEEQQLQKAIGQVLRYCQLLEAEHGRTTRPMIATEVKPSRPLWDELCAREGIELRWGPENLVV